ncbi:MAG: hypothetical protein COC01_06620 [Bacteroidetes bacterium]|nr:MAG: hypothetical protein COC01_06620 [Bacteroidota bacterium]
MFYGANPKLFEFSRTLRLNETEAEKVIWERLKKKQVMGYRFRRQHPIMYFIADFYCHTTKLIIEIDGKVHDIREQYEYDQGKDFELMEQGLRVLRFTNDQIFSDIDTVITTIKQELSNTQKFPKRNLEVYQKK